MAEGNKLQEWQELTEILQNAGADAIELNLSCQNGLPMKENWEAIFQKFLICAEK